MTTMRTHFTFRVDTWTPDGESIVEHVAGIEDYQVAPATYRAACERWPGTHRNRAIRHHLPRVGDDAEIKALVKQLRFLWIVEHHFCELSLTEV
jgi:hypothetical protein